MKNGLLIVGRFLIGATVAYGVNKMLDEKTDELISAATGALVAGVIL